MAEVDLEEVLYRLALHARHLVTAASCLGVEDLVLPGGDSPADLASAAILRFLDPQNVSVAWSQSKGPPTTARLVAYLCVVLERDFLDFVRSKRYRTTVYPDRDRQDDGARDIGCASLDRIPAHSASPEDEAMRKQTTAWLFKHFEKEPDIEAILRLQLEVDGYKAFSNRELAQMLAVPVAEIENRKRRLKTRLKGLAAGRQTRGARHG